ncbi:MAG TPA: hypothetical protein DCP90_00965 [Clostridiales bacterium]|nr:MAG: hypothetical protein A2Y22_07780 [Clostridiales bacterium GWD2_32_59]HAN09167.1 hypothetical protein [Clostridiales bacterium]
MYNNYTLNDESMTLGANTMDSNKDYADMLMNIYAGEVSEFTLTMQYMYHHNFYKDVNNELAEDVAEIHADDMEHMHILADLIVDLGGDPEYKYSNHKSEYWSAKLVNYKKNICDMLKADMSLKKAGIEGYTKLIAMIDDTRIKTILNSILKAEIMHYNIIESYYKKFCISYRSTENDDDVLGITKELPAQNDIMMEDEEYEPIYMDDNYQNNVLPDMDMMENEEYGSLFKKDDYKNNVSPNMDVKDMYENEEILPDNDLYMPDEYVESIFCEKGKHFITENGLCGYECEFGCGCNPDCINCNARIEPYIAPISPIDYDADDNDNVSNCRSCRPRLRNRRYL